MRIFNPYIVGNPIEDRSLFFGREDDFSFIENKIIGEEKGGLLVLCGSRRSGKTSILFQIRNGRLGTKFVPVLIDMQAMVVGDDAEFLAEIVEGLALALDDGDVVTAYREYIECRSGNAHKAFLDTISFLRGPLNGRKVVLMFDEYELFETHIRKDRFSTDVLNLLANWMEHRDGVFIVFTGSDRLEERSPGFWEHFLGKAQHRRISFLSRGDARRLMEEPIAGQVSYSSGCLDDIWEITAGQPFYTQVICQALIDRLNEHDSVLVTKEDIAGVLNEIVDNPLPQMVFTWSALSAPEKLALALVAELTSGATGFLDVEDLASFAAAEGIPVENTALHEALEALFHKEMLSKKGGSAKYRFKMDLWRRWIRRMHSVWQVVNEIGLSVAPKARRSLGIRLIFIAGILILGLLGYYGVFVGSPGTQETMPKRPPERTNVLPAQEDEAYVLSVTSIPEGAVVTAESVELGRTPLINIEVETDSVVVQVKKRGYEPAQELMVFPPGRQGHLSFELHPRPGALQVSGNEDGIRVQISGDARTWVTPCLISNLEPNRTYDLQASLPYHGTIHRQVWISPDSTSTIEVRLRRKLFGTMIIADPQAVVSDSTGVLGTTPLNLERPAGRFQLSFSAEGYKRKDALLSVPNEGQLHVNLQRLGPGTLVVKLTPYGDVMVDGTLVATNRLFYAAELAAGEHHVTLRNATHGSSEATISIVPGDTIVVRHNFNDQAEH